MPLISLQAVPAWKWFVLGAEQDSVQVLQTGRRWWDRSSPADTSPAGFPNEPHFVSPSHAQDSALPLPPAPFGMSLTLCTGLMDEVVFIPWVPPRPLGDKLSLRAAGWYQLSPYPGAGVKQPLFTLCVLSWLLSAGKVIQDILTDLCDLLSSLQHLSYWRIQTLPLRRWTNSSLRSVCT